MEAILSTRYDVVILGAGAAGMMAAIEAGKRGRKVLIIDHADKPGEKIRISGGGRCNFTNIYASPDQFISDNPKFAISALSRYKPADFIALLQRHGIAFHEKTLGQLFCDGSATQVIDMLTGEMAEAGVDLRLSTSLERAEKTADGFSLVLSSGAVSCSSLVIATGGKSIPKMGATSLGYELAAQFGLPVVTTRPALVPLTFDSRLLVRTAALAGLSLPVRVSKNTWWFQEALLFTHRGLSGPAILQISSYWRESEAINVDLLPGRNAFELLRANRSESPKISIATAMTIHLPRRLAQMMAVELNVAGQIGDASDEVLKRIGKAVNSWVVKPIGSEGYRTAEVTLGGVATGDLNSATMEARNVPGLFVIGEVVDVTGWLGGYNFQWAWASGWAAGQVA